MANNLETTNTLIGKLVPIKSMAREKNISPFPERSRAPLTEKKL